MTTTLQPLPGGGNATWAEVLESQFENIGSNPLIVFQEALNDHGSTTIGPSDNGEHTSNCPRLEHTDQKPSLRWRQAPDGQILFKCQAGCEPQDIIDALQLDYKQLKWSTTEYTYRNSLREVVGIHVKKPERTGKKFWWAHLENGQKLPGREPTWEHVLWALPDLQEAAERAHTEHKRLHVWLAEGEKDAISIADAFASGWTPADQPADEVVHVVTTCGDGAAGWKRELSEQVIGLGPNEITVVCDSDQSGTQRGTRVIDALREIDSQLSMRAINWLGQSDIADAADAVASYGRFWLQRSTPTDDADIYLWCAAETGWLSEAETGDVDGSPTGKRMLHRTLNPGTPRVRREVISRYPVRVAASTVDTDGKAVGWELDLGPGGTIHIRTADLDGSSLEKWNADSGVFIVSTRSLTAALRAFLGFHGVNASSMTVYDHEGWVDDERFVTRNGLLIGPEGESASASLSGTSNAHGGADWFYGLGDAQEAADTICQLLTFRDLNESGPVLAWLAAQSIRPRSLKASGAGFVPMLQVPGASGIGKTSFLKLATRLFGFCGNPISNVTSAGLVRTLALTTGVVWIDDFTDYDDTIRDIIRGGITGAGRTRGTTASERGVVRDESYAALINSGEHAFDANERAMSQRSVILEFAKAVQGRESKVNAGKNQYAELEALGVARDDKGVGLSRLAGTLIRGLWDAAAEIDAQGVGTGSGTGVRGQAAWEFVRYGGLVLVQWLRNMNLAENKVELLEAAILKVCDAEATKAARRERTGTDVYLVQEIVPRYLMTARQGFDTAVTTYAPSLTPEAIRAAIRHAWLSHVGQGPHGAVHSARAVVVIYQGETVAMERDPDSDPPVLGVAVSAEALYQWVTTWEGNKAGVSKDERHVSSSGIAMQLKQVADKKITDGDSESIRVRLGRTAQVPRYRIITEPEITKWLIQ